MNSETREGKSKQAAAPSIYLTTRQAAHHLRDLGVPISPRTLEKYRFDRSPPAYVKLGGRVFYDLRGLKEWLASRVVEPGKSGSAQDRR